MKNFTIIVDHIKSDNGLSNRERLLFHLFNKNGLVAKKLKLSESINGLIIDDVLPVGWMFAYGYADKYEITKMHELNDKYNKIPTIKLNVLLQMLSDKIDKIEKKLTEEVYSANPEEIITTEHRWYGTPYYEEND